MFLFVYDEFSGRSYRVAVLLTLHNAGLLPIESIRIAYIYPTSIEFVTVNFDKISYYTL